MEDREWEQQWKIINNYWTRLSKISWFVCGEQINICRSRRLSQIIDLHDKQLLFYHLITEFVLFNEYPWEAKRSAIFKQEWSQEGEKHGFLYACAEYYLQPNTVGRHCTWADHYLQAVICRSRGGLLTNEKKEKFASNDNVDYLPVKIKLTYILACLLDLAAKNRWTAVWLTAQSGNKPNAPPMTKVHIDRRWVGSGLRLFRGENKQLTSRKLLVHGTIKFAKMNHNFDYKARPVSIDLWSPSVAHSYTVSTGNHMILSAIRNR